MLTDIMQPNQEEHDRTKSDEEVAEYRVEQPAILLEQNFVEGHQKCNTAQDGPFVLLIVSSATFIDTLKRDLGTDDKLELEVCMTNQEDWRARRAARLRPP